MNYREQSRRIAKALRKFNQEQSKIRTRKVNSKAARKLRKMAEYVPGSSTKYGQNKKKAVVILPGETKANYKDLKKLYKKGELEL